MEGPKCVTTAEPFVVKDDAAVDRNVVFGRNFRHRREVLNLTRRHVADACGVTARAIGFWEKGQCEPRLSFAQTRDLLIVLRCTLNELTQMTSRNYGQLGKLVKKSPNMTRT